jgi:hypothetical protein
MSVFYGLAGLLSVIGFLLLKRIDRGPYPAERIIGFCFSLLWMIFFSLSLLVITSVISSYIYGMPFHRCPFDILKKEYYSVGYLIYSPLFAATFFGTAAGMTPLLTTFPSLVEPVRSFRKASLRLCLLLLPLFLAVVSWFPAVYLLSGNR